MSTVVFIESPAPPASAASAQAEQIKQLEHLVEWARSGEAHQTVGWGAGGIFGLALLIAALLQVSRYMKPPKRTKTKDPN